jgi:hypothetical protein
MTIVAAPPMKNWTLASCQFFAVRSFVNPKGFDLPKWTVLMAKKTINEAVGNIDHSQNDPKARTM